MKKNLILGVVLAIAGLSLTSCQKEKLPVPGDAISKNTTRAASYRVTDDYARIYQFPQQDKEFAYTQILKTENGITTDITPYCTIDTSDIPAEIRPYISVSNNVTRLKVELLPGFGSAPHSYYTFQLRIKSGTTQVASWWVCAEKYYGENPLPWPPMDI